LSGRRPELLLKDILNAIEKVERYTEGLSYQDFLEDEKTKDAVLRNLEVIGEAVSNLPEDFKKKHHSVPWKAIKGLRNRLIHGYFVIDFSIVWQVVKEELPSLKVKI